MLNIEINNIVSINLFLLAGGAVASWLERSTPDRVVRGQVLAGDIALCSWARHFTLTVPLSTQDPVVQKPINTNPIL